MTSSEADLLRVLRIVAMTNEERMDLFPRGADVEGEARWFLEHIDDIAPELHARRWVLFKPFDQQPGSVVVTSGNLGRMRAVEITELGRRALRESVS